MLAMCEALLGALYHHVVYSREHIWTSLQVNLKSFSVLKKIGFDTFLSWKSTIVPGRL